MPTFNWQNLQAVQAMKFVCGHCGQKVASERGWYATIPEGGNAWIYVCPYCGEPSYFHGERQVPGVAFGNAVDSVPDGIATLYAESRNAYSVSAFTASVLASRKILMNIAVEKGANENLRFIEYVEYLAERGYVPPDGKDWVDHIRRKGNEATHEIQLMSSGDASELISFVEMLLKFIFEFPARVPVTPDAAT